MIQLFFNEFVNLKLNPEQAVQDWNTELEATNKYISWRNHWPSANGASKDSSSEIFEGQNHRGHLCSTDSSFRVSSIHQQFDDQQRRKQLSFFYKSAFRAISLPKQPNSPHRRHPSMQQNRYPCWHRGILLTTTDVLKATFILNRKPHHLWLISGSAWRFPG